MTTNTTRQPAAPQRETFACPAETLDEIVRFAEANGMADATFHEVTEAWKKSKLH
ncbi:hypothetical protein D3C73_1629190 [compost metagenome]